MEILFIDESDVYSSGNRECLILTGLSIKEEDLLKVEDKLEELKLSLNLKNLKELRTSRLRTEQKLDYTDKIIRILKETNIKVISSVLNVGWDEYRDSYFGGLVFIIERFFLRIKRNNEKAFIISDSFDRNISSYVSAKASDYLRNQEITLHGESKGKIKESIYPALFFQNDNYSNLLQVVDLICGSLQFAVREFKVSNPTSTIKGNEDLLKDMNPYLEKYWIFFEKGFRNSVTGWGIKTWD